MNYAKLYFGLRINRFNGFCKTLQIVYAGDKNVFDTPVLKISEYLQPELRTFTIANIQADDAVNSPVYDASLIAYFVMNGIQPRQKDKLIPAAGYANPGSAAVSCRSPG